MQPHAGSGDPPMKGGLAQYFVEHREVAWMFFFAVLIWGWVSYTKLAQQEDPKIPDRGAQLVTRFPGATASKVEQLVTEKLEKKIAENEAVDEIISQSRSGVSVISIMLRPGSQDRISQEWDKLRASLTEVMLPDGSQSPFLDTNFGNTIALLYAITSPPITDAECIARANMIRTRLARMRANTGAEGHIAVAAFFPPAIPKSYQAIIVQKFVTFNAQEKLAGLVQTVQGESFLLGDLATTATREQAKAYMSRFIRSITGTDGDLHPDFPQPIILLGDEDPLPQIREAAMPRYSYRQLEMMADQFEDEIKQIPGAARVMKIGIVNETIHLVFALSRISGYETTANAVIKAIAARNAIISGGSFSTEGHNFPVQLSGEFGDERQMLGAVVGVARDGTPFYLRDLFDVIRGYDEPIPYNVDVLVRGKADGPLEQRRAVMVSVEMKQGEIIGDFNKAVQQIVDKTQSLFPEGAEILTISDQPTAVANRIGHFVKCFLEAILVVIIVALFLMDWRSAVVVALAIPLTVAMTLGGMHLLNIPLHQISIAALIIALGMLVDDPVVASDAINREMHHGAPPSLAAWLGPYKLRRAIFFGTLINIFAFLPLLLLPGDTGDFIEALPLVVTLSLVASRIVSMTFVPQLGYYLLKGQKGLEEGGELRKFFLFRWVDMALIGILPPYKRLLEAALRRPLLVILIAYGILAASFALTRFFGTQFFPPAERNQFVIDIDLPESASIGQTRLVSQEAISLLEKYKAITSAAVFMGGSAPRFYYNFMQQEPANYLAQIIVNTRTDKDVPELMTKLRPELDAGIAGARCTVRQLEQGPPVEAPIQIRFSGPDLDMLRGLADQAATILREAGGYHVYDNLGRRLPTLNINIDQERANTLGIGNSQIGEVIQTALTGLRVTEIREGDHLIPVSVRLRTEDRNEADKLGALYVESINGEILPLSSFADLSIKPEFATIAHYNLLRAVTVKSYSRVGELPSAMLERARQKIDQIQLPPGYKLEFAGEAKEMKKSLDEMMIIIQVSLALIALAMVIQFNSVMKSIIVMLTVPLGLIGAFAGLAIMHASFGFVALVAIVSLAGVVVSHIIVLSDFIEEARAEGMDLEHALVQAGLVRLRAVLVTVLATVGGLIPLALTGGELWRPLTSVHIFGLLFATLLTLLLLPALYYFFCAKLKLIK
ncbi:MAG: efflux RND transporter permease subunit [bacterium]